MKNRSQLQAADYDFDRWWSSVSEAQILEIGRNTNFSLHPAIYWTHLGPQQFVDFIGKVENFEADYDRFLAAVNIDGTSRENANVRQDPAREPEYLDRMSRQSIEKINALFAVDFETFGYQKV